MYKLFVKNLHFLPVLAVRFKVQMVSGSEVSRPVSRVYQSQTKYLFHFSDILFQNKIIHLVWKYCIPPSYLRQDL